MPVLLKPAPTRLRLVLWSLWNGLQEFPESPPPGLVTIPNIADVPKSHYTLAGYHPAGSRAIRIDMLERLADILRQKDSRAGFEATPDMLSITGMTLEQFNDLMGGLGYKGERAERAKVKAAPVPVTVDPNAPIQPIPEGESAFVQPDPDAVPEMEVFYTFTWAPKPRPRPERAPRPERSPRPERAQQKEGEAGAPQADRPNRGPRKEGEGRPNRGPRKDGKPEDGNRGPRRDGKGDFKGKRDERPKTYDARPPRPEKPIDPDNPFAALMALKAKL